MKPFKGLLLLAASALFGGAYFWHQADHGASDRAAWINGEVPTDDILQGVAFTTGGFLNRDVVVSIYTFGDTDKTAEDSFIENAMRGELAEAFYKHGFRRIVASGSNFARLIVAAPKSARL